MAKKYFLDSNKFDHYIYGVHHKSPKKFSGQSVYFRNNAEIANLECKVIS